MQTTRIILKVPFHKHPAGAVFEVAETTEISGWPEDERLREKLSFHDKRVYHLPDGGRGFAVSLPVSDTAPCPEHVFEGVELRTGECRVTRVFTGHPDETTDAWAAPCGQLKEENVVVERNAALKSQGFRIDLPPFAKIATKMVLSDTLRNETVLEYELRNYKHTDTQLHWDVSDLRPGFYDLRVCFPGDWMHTVRFIKFFPFFVDAEKIPPAPQKRWQPMVDSILEKFEQPAADPAGSPADELRNQALDYCLEWGAMFNQPTQPRMMAQFGLTQAEADELDRLAREVRSFVYGLCEQELEGKMLESDIHFETKRQYPWVSGANFNRMKNVGMFYARK